MKNKKEMLINEIIATANIADMWWDMWQNSDETDNNAEKYWLQDEQKVRGLCLAFEIVYGEHMTASKARCYMYNFL